jgi:hypothetical protein
MRPPPTWLPPPLQTFARTSCSACAASARGPSPKALPAMLEAELEGARWCRRGGRLCSCSCRRCQSPLPWLPVWHFPTGIAFWRALASCSTACSWPTSAWTSGPGLCSGRGGKTCIRPCCTRVCHSSESCRYPPHWALLPRAGVPARAEVPAWLLTLASSSASPQRFLAALSPESFQTFRL